VIRAIAPRSDVKLRRELGRWDLTAIGVNQVIGSAIFLMPSQVAALVGNWSPLAFLLAGAASLVVALSFAEVSSRFEGTGGAYLYTRAAFGRFAGFEVGWMQWVTRVTSLASVINGLVLAVGFYWPALTGGPGRAALISGLLTFLAAVNIRGIRQTAWLVDFLTIGKIVPLGVFIASGLAWVNQAAFSPLPAITWNQASAAALLLVFVFGGYDVIPVPAGEASDPRRHAPFALVATILVVTAVMTAAQVVAMGVLPNLADSTTPLADAALVTMGSAGALLIGVGSVISITGNNAGQVLSGSRVLFALAEHRDLPSVFARVHPVFRTPANAVLFTSVVALALALTGSFVTLAAASAVARLVIYTGASASVLRLRALEGRVPPASFTAPLGPAVPILAMLVSLTIIAGAGRAQIVGGLTALGIGAALYVLRGRDRL
jgi:amino acid transporter